MGNLFKYFSVTPPDYPFGYYALLYNNTLYRLHINRILEKETTEWYTHYLNKLHKLKPGQRVKLSNNYLVECLRDDFFDFNTKKILEYQSILNGSNYVGTGKLYVVNRKSHNQGSIYVPMKLIRMFGWEHKTPLYCFYNKKTDSIHFTKQQSSPKKNS